MKRTDLAAWLRPALISLDNETLARCETWVNALSDRPEDPGYLVLAAHQRFPGELLEVLEAAIHESDGDYTVRKKRALVSRLSAAAAFSIMSQDNGKSTATALYIRSAAFINLRPSVDGLLKAALDCTDRMSTYVRVHAQAPSPVPARRRRTDEPPADRTPLTNETLREELARRDAAITRVSKRTEQLLEVNERNQEVVEESIDALLWGQSPTSRTTGAPWTSMEPLDRAVLAGHETAALLRRAPARKDLTEMMMRVAGDAGRLYDINAVASALWRSAIVQPRAPRDNELLPFSTLLSRRDAAVSEPFSTASFDDLLGLATGWQRSALEIAEQLVVERSLELITS